MNTQVVYFSKSGNTKKLAEAIAQTAGVKATPIQGGKAVTQADILFLGASVYWAGIDGAVKRYIEQLDGRKVKKVVVFSTSALAERAFPDIKKRLTQAGIDVAEENFYCRGQFMAMHKNRPNQDDIQEVQAFTKKILAKYGK